MDKNRIRKAIETLEEVKDELIDFQGEGAEAFDNLQDALIDLTAVINRLEQVISSQETE